MAGVEPAPSEERAGEADLEAVKKLVVNSLAAALEKNPGPKLGAEPPEDPVPTADEATGAEGAAVLGA